MDIIVFGLGKLYQRKKYLLNKQHIVGLIDNNQSLWGTEIDGMQVKKVEEIHQISYDAICIMSIHKEAMIEQLIEMGVDEHRILDMDSFEKRNVILYNQFSFFSKEKKKVLFFTHDLSASGAPIVLFYFAKLIKKHGFAPCILCKTEGIMQTEFLNENIPVIINADISPANWLLWEIIKSFDYYVLNTIIFSPMVEPIGLLGKKTVWWLHDSEMYYKDRSKTFFPKQIPDTVSVCTVSTWAKKAFQKYIHCEKISDLHYGIPDLAVSEKKRTGKKVFAIIGAIYSRKAQDLFIDAVARLSEEDREKGEFWIIGIVADTDYYEMINNKMKTVGNIQYLGDLDRVSMLKKYEEIDVVCCPSRDDPLPVVVTEAFMNSKVAVVSENTGMATLIKQGENGFVIQNENSRQLAGVIKDILDGNVDAEWVGRNARKLYEEKFSMEAFEKRILELTEEWK